MCSKRINHSCFTLKSIETNLKLELGNYSVTWVLDNGYADKYDEKCPEIYSVH